MAKGKWEMAKRTVHQWWTGAGRLKPGLHTLRGLVVVGLMLLLVGPGVWTAAGATGGGSGGTGSGNFNQVKWVTPQMYGALGGANDDTIAFSNALNSGSAVYVPNYTNYTVGQLFMSNHTTLFGFGSKLIFKAGPTGYMIDTTTSTNVYISGIFLDGGNPPDTNVTYWQGSQGTRSGIQTYVFAAQSVIENCTCNNFTDAGFRFGTQAPTPQQIGPVGVPQTYRQSPMRFANNEARGNYIGYDVAGYDANNLQEYIFIINCTAHNNYYGGKTANGNTYIQDCDWGGNNYGVYILAGAPNSAHGQMRGGNLNHSQGACIYTENVTTGFLFDGVHTFGSTFIWFHNSTGIIVQNGMLDVVYGLNDSGASAGTNIIQNCFYPTYDPSVVITNAPGGGTLYFNNNLQAFGGSANAVNFYPGVSNSFSGVINATKVYSQGVIAGNGSGVTNAVGNTVATNTHRVFRGNNLVAGGTFLNVSATAYFIYLGRVATNFTPASIEVQVTTAGAGAQTAEVGFFSTPTPPNKAGQSLTKLVATGSVNALTGTGVIKNTSALATEVAAGTYLWVGFRTAMATTQPTCVGVSYDFGEGNILTTAGAGVLTGAGPFAGVVPAVGTATVGPEVRATFD